MRQQQIQINVPNLFYALEHNQLSIQDALIDLIDNSIDAKASMVSVISDQQKLYIIDNGYGMNTSDMINALGLALNIKENQLGRYGIGLKVSSFSFFNSLKIISKKDSVLSGVHQTLNNVIDGSTLVCTILDQDEIMQTLRSKIFGFLKNDYESFTIIELSQSKGPYRRIYTNILNNTPYILQTYHKLIPDVLRLNVLSTSVSNKTSTLITDPLQLNNKDSKILYDNNLPIDIEFNGKQYNSAINIKCCVVPQYMGTATTSGIYIYRNNRLIKRGNTWERLAPSKSPTLRRLRIDISFNSELDDLFNPTYQKNNVDMIPELRYELSKILDPIFDEVRKNYSGLEDIQAHKVQKTISKKKKKTLLQLLSAIHPGITLDVRGLGSDGPRYAIFQTDKTVLAVNRDHILNQQQIIQKQEA